MITIRRAIPIDSPLIIDFQQKMAWETERITLPREIITKGVEAVFINEGLGQYWVAAEENRVVASLLVTYEWSDWRNANVWWFQSVYVLPEYRRKGIFRSMYSAVKHEAEKQGIAGLRLYVEINNMHARKTYEALGMKSDHYTMYEWMNR